MSSPTNSAAAQVAALVVKVRGGAQICVPPTLDQMTSYILLEQEDWFEDEIRFVRHWLKPGMRVVDAGASFGLYSTAAAQAVGSAGRVWSFEPTPHTADHLSRTLALNGCSQVQLNRVALSDRAGTLSIAAGITSEMNAVSGQDRATTETVEVASATLDAMAREQQWEGVDFVKLDVEGHEIPVIQGGQGFLARDSPLVMLEVKNQQDELELSALGFLAEMQFKFYRLLPGLLTLVPVDLDEAMDGYLLNLFACNSNRAARLSAAGVLAELGGEPSAGEADWAGYIGAVPYAEQKARTWTARPGLFASSASKAYWKGLAAFARSQNASASTSERCGLLHSAKRLVAEAVQSDGRMAYRISLARLAWELGERAEAISLLTDLRQGQADEAEAAWEVPFLAPGPRYDAIRPAGRGAEWLQCAVTEQYEKLRAYSSTFVLDTTPEVLESVRALPFCSPEMERRAQLARIATGKQAGPECSPRLRERSEENLNPEFWCGEAA